MSIITLLRRKNQEGKKDVYLKFKDTFLKPKINCKRELLAPALTQSWSITGHAFDYLLRFHLKYKYPEQVIDRDEWVAKQGLEYIKKRKGSPRLFRAASKIYTKAQDQCHHFLNTGILEDDLIQSCIMLAKMDSIFRTGDEYYPETVEEFLEIDKKIVQDLKNLISIVPFEDFKPDTGILLNPVFGIGSQVVGGSDADLIIDNKIIDIKVTKNLYLSPEMWYQIIGYYLIYCIDVIDALQRKRSVHYPGFDKNVNINQIGIYFARHGYLWTYEIDKILRSGKNFPEIVEWLIERGITEYHQ
jgi:hypothetical protein